jgi:hypothetical protein
LELKKELNLGVIHEKIGFIPDSQNSGCLMFKKIRKGIL